MVILFLLNPTGENLQVWTDLECSMGYKWKFKQLSFTMLITKQGESLCSYVWPEGTDGSRGARIEKLTLCSFSVQMSKLMPVKGFLQSYIFSLTSVIMVSLGKRIKKEKFRAIFSPWCKLCHESCRGCMFTVFSSHQRTLLFYLVQSHFYWWQTIERQWVPQLLYTECEKNYLHSLFLTWCLMISFRSLQFWYYEEKWKIIQHLPSLPCFCHVFLSISVS